MSYILEALKKAQAERQLGNAPTIHAPAPNYTAGVSRTTRNPLIVGAIAGTFVVALGAIFLLRQPAPAPASAAALQVASAPAPAPVPAPVPMAPPPTPAEPVKAEPPPTPVKPAAKPPAPAVKPKPAPRAEPVEAVRETPAPVPVAATPAPEDSVGPLQSLPETVQREVPQVTFGGYIYSPNPAERLLLVDKMLRREGEEVAPGLVLERLLPKAAIMNFRGYRYRVAY